ncbi:bifunctional precorrin-2 dehydrogenase/sirohydrochlorin ferrochelatase [Phenylobacterium sp.]|uniref:precorrin-2 dehydrogenase/sirohydrochlorin ferrochelatase family protein n=1 Tax=Phenylobacterium sp. TaxID=1871053 RepID=UPI00273340C0|nr:NAD(P)-dependent oxidoreductase [Phenylobacterium sp.]MDP3852788.1 NAD(P)-dependent oxidoreductase [Phenylobacterium sp.]
MDAFPAFIPLHGATVVIAGSGEAAEAKARLFESSPATVVRIEGPAALIAGAYAGATLAFIATDDDIFAQAAAQAARAAGAWVNVVDRLALCDFTTPSVIDRGEVVAAIGTGGASPMLAAMLRNDIEQRVPEGAGRVAALFRKHQDEVRKALPDLPARRAFLREALAGPAAQAAQAGDMEAATRLFLEGLAKGPMAQGKVQFVAGRGPADLLTLRASRALAAADVLVADTDADPDILSLARRDAERLAPDAATPDRLIALAASGLRVVRVICGPPSDADLQALAAAGAATEVLSAAPDR